MEFFVEGSTPREDSEVREDFTGLVGMTPMLNLEKNILVRVAHVRFEPGARTNWHTHPAGQILQVTKGGGLIQTWDEKNKGEKAHAIRPGDTIYIPPGEKHWHGALPDEAMEHIAHSMGGPTDWMEPVSAEDYESAS